MTFHELYIRYSADVYRFAFWLCGNASDAEDIASETFVRAWAGKAPIRTETVQAYLLSIARNLYYERNRKSKREIEISAELPKQSKSLEESFILNEKIHLVWQKLSDIKEIDREAFLLRVLYEMPYAEIARILNLSLSATKVKIHRVRLKIAQEFKE